MTSPEDEVLRNIKRNWQKKEHTVDNFVETVEEVREGPSKRTMAKAEKAEVPNGPGLMSGVQKCIEGMSPPVQTRELLKL